jgi:hypothetical protein
MPQTRSNHTPRRLDKFWHEGNGSGYIVQVNWSDKTVEVVFYNLRNSWVEYSFDEIEMYWTDKFGGTYYIENL